MAAKKRRKQSRMQGRGQANERRSNKRLVGIAAIGITLLALFAAYWTLRPTETTADNQVSPESGAPAVVEGNEPVPPAPAADTGVSFAAPENEMAEEAPAEEAHIVLPAEGSQPGSTAPDFTLPSLDGEAVTLTDYRGKPTFITFFHSW